MFALYKINIEYKRSQQHSNKVYVLVTDLMFSVNCHNLTGVLKLFTIARKTCAVSKNV